MDPETDQLLGDGESRFLSLLGVSALDDDVLVLHPSLVPQAGDERLPPRLSQ